MVPLSSVAARIQCLAVPLSGTNLVALLQSQADLGNNLDMADPGVPCLRLPYLGKAGMDVALGVVEGKECNWGMGLLPVLVVNGCVAPTPSLPDRVPMEREMVGLLRSVALPNVKSTSDLAAMLEPRLMAWEDFEPIPLPTIWQDFADLQDRDNLDRSRHGGESWSRCCSWSVHLCISWQRILFPCVRRNIVGKKGW